MGKHLIAISVATLIVAVLLAAALAGGASSAQVRQAGSSLKPHGTVKGAAELCVPAHPNAGSSKASCYVFTKKWSGCTHGVCRTLNRVVAKNTTGQMVAEGPLKRGRFVLFLQPGTYTIELLFTAKHKKPVILGPTHRAKVRVRKTTRLVFKGYAG